MIMSLLRSQNPRPTKRQRRGETKSKEPSGVATFITVNWQYQLIAQGDRHDMSGIKADWENCFVDKAPYQVYTIPDETLFIGNQEFSDEQVGKAIREHAKSKGWFWKAECNIQSKLVMRNPLANFQMLKKIFVLF